MSPTLLFLVVLLSLAIARVHGVYEIVDTVNCVNILNVLKVQYVQRHHVLLDTLQYNHLSFPTNTGSPLTIAQPTLHISSAIHDVQNEYAANQRNAAVMRKYVQENTASASPDTSIVFLMITAVTHAPLAEYDDIPLIQVSLQQNIQTVVNSADLQTAMSVDPSKTTVTRRECYWEVLELAQSDRNLACVLTVTHNKCVYLPYDKSLFGTNEALSWILGLASMLSGLGNLMFQLDFEYLYGDNNASECDATLVPGGNTMRKMIPFRLCKGLSVQARCENAGMPCEDAQMQLHTDTFFEVLSIITGTSASLITSQDVIPMPTKGTYKLMYDTVKITHSNTNLPLSDTYFKGTTKRICNEGLIPHTVLVKEFGFFYESRCKPCPLHTYYSEARTIRTDVTKDSAKTKTLFLGMPNKTQPPLHTTHTYRLVENHSDASIMHDSWKHHRFNSFSVAVGTTVTVYIDKNLEFDKIRAPPTISHTSTVVDSVDGRTVLIITIPNIYGEDDDDADNPIFIDVHPKLPTAQNVTNQDFLAIFPLRHPIQQVCTPCPDNFVTAGYAAVGSAACIAFEGARRVQTPDATILQKRRTTVGREGASPLFDTIAGYQLKEIAYTDDATQLQMFLETDAFGIARRLPEVLHDISRLFGVDDTKSTNLSFAIGKVEDSTVQPRDPAGARRRALLQSNTPPATTDLVSVTIHVHRENHLAQTSMWSVFTWPIVLAIVLIAVFSAVFVVVYLLIVSHCSPDGSNCLCCYGDDRYESLLENGNHMS